MKPSSEEDEWVETDGVEFIECEQCGMEKPCIIADAPFLSEVYPDIKGSPMTEQTWCKPCWIKRKNDI